MPLRKSAVLLRVLHGLVLVYFIICIGLIYWAAWQATFSVWVMIAAISVCLEGLAVFVFNNGDCPLMHVQRRLGDNKAFLALFLPERVARWILPVVGLVTTAGLLALLIRLGYS